MPRLTRPDGVELHWEQRGDGPPALIAMHWAGHPRMFEPLAEELARDHTVVLYHPRGTGESSRRGPYDTPTDCADLTAVLEEAGGEPAVGVAIADGANRIIRVAATRPDLLRAAVIASAHPLGQRGLARDGEALAGSPSVRDAIVSLLEHSYRAGLRSLMESTNPELEEADVQRRVDEVETFCEAEAGVGRLRAWMTDSAEEECRAIGGRLWWLMTAANPWFPADMADQLPELLPDAHMEAVQVGPVNRPDLTAAVMRRLTRAGAERT